MKFHHSIKNIQSLSNQSVEYLNQNNEYAFFKLTEELLKSKPAFRYLSIYGQYLGRRAVNEPDKYLDIIDKLFNKDWHYGFDQDNFNLDDPAKRKFWNQQNLKALVLGARISIVSSVLGAVGLKYPKRVIPIIKNYLILGDGWYICDGLAMALGQLLVAHFEFTLSILKLWAQEENKWLRRGSIVATNRLMKEKDMRLSKTLVIYNILFADPERHVKMGVAWMLREMAKYQKELFIDLINNWQKMKFNQHTIWIVKNGVRNLKINERTKYLKLFQ